MDFHAHLSADDNIGYFVSLCHGWSSGPTSWLTERVLGIRPTSGGFKTADIAPDLGDLSWAEGDVPTPRGLIHERASMDGGRMTVSLLCRRAWTPPSASPAPPPPSMASGQRPSGPRMAAFTCAWTRPASMSSSPCEEPSGHLPGAMQYPQRLGSLAGQIRRAAFDGDAARVVHLLQTRKKDAR